MTEQPHQDAAPPVAAQAETFRLLNLHMEVADAPPFPTAQVLLAMWGIPPYNLDGPKRYTTFLPPDLAVQVAHGLLEVAGEAAQGQQDTVDVTAPGVTVATPAEAAAMVARSQAFEGLRG